MQKDALRIDSWLWRTRFFKTRGRASAAVKNGRVHVNGGRIKNSRLVTLDDELQIKQARGTYRLTVVAIPERRGPASEAESCYRVDEFVETKSRRVNAQVNAPHPASTASRPDKQSRRKMRELKGRF